VFCPLPLTVCGAAVTTPCRAVVSPRPCPCASLVLLSPSLAPRAPCCRGCRAQEIETLTAAAGGVKGVIDYENPNNSLYTFVGTLTMTLEGRMSTIPVGPHNVVLRGCVLKSCHYVIGVAVFTGADTKLMQNQRPAPSKQVRWLGGRCDDRVHLRFPHCPT
jgi:hypothetical protein